MVPFPNIFNDSNLTAAPQFYLVLPARR